MRYRHVCIESFGYTLPDEIITTEEIERRLAPVYRRLRLPEGRLELMTGIRQRRFFPHGAKPSEQSVESGRLALEVAELDRAKIGVLIHGSVCRDHLEPGTACSVHHQLELPGACVVYDVSNACLGVLNGVLQIANMIELGQIEAGLVVGTETGRSLVENTIETLNADESLTRKQIKQAVASLTIGSGSCAILLTHERISRTKNHLTAAAVRANTEHHGLCHSLGAETPSANAAPLMQTDSERLMREGVATGVETFKAFLEETSWSHDTLHRTFCHQVGVAHRRMMLDSLDLDDQRDFATVEFLGNTGSVALPTAMAIGLENGAAGPGDNIGMLGIGSGVNCIMLGVAWRKTLVGSRLQPQHRLGLEPASVVSS